MTTTTTRIAISGNTYPVKDKIKALGGRWDAERKAWMVPSERAEQARQLVAGAPTGYVSTHSSRPALRRRRWNQDDECEMCGRNKYTCGHCIGW